ncbi:unnamed protein product [Spirodela intermedia]|uniref:Uncharacterized protein n=1 Tax=Spirodela intermedia TaxID=51605 RepID=A0A7I8IZP8_SPIIN|nr:unnamed protein product [Spirodela intermedia]CAA6663446.1 unnamed protein product [Spirodela intermedia]
MKGLFCVGERRERLKGRGK